MPYSTAYAQRVARSYFTSPAPGLSFEDACRGTMVTPAMLAGLISVENATRAPTAKRYEPHVYRKLWLVQKGLLRRYNNITPAQIKGASDAALRNLATSWGLGQIMGWHCVNNLKRPDGSPATIADLRGADGLRYVVQLLLIASGNDVAEAGAQLARAERLEAAGQDDWETARGLGSEAYERILRTWNTGRATGKTHDPFYVRNATRVMFAYRALEREQHDC